MYHQEVRWLSRGNLAHFPNLKEVDRTQSTAAEKGTEYAQIITDRQEEFRRRFKDFHSSEDAITLFAQPFSVRADTVPEELQMQLIKFQCDSWLKQKFDKVPLNEFYKFVIGEISGDQNTCSEDALALRKHIHLWADI
ncbi:hypothetical protein AAFF_G00157850 [Aldrovandia affinis]|uniref:Uncharacterized protein n=1 Tax=Aldrovandia affinis TaxID=143900 RepID=A0AAD7RN78_9TELE|nr:hypothetical protein AAFF_G00157850 [Aldrovandia affinis]